MSRFEPAAPLDASHVDLNKIFQISFMAAFCPGCWTFGASDPPPLHRGDRKRGDCKRGGGGATSPSPVGNKDSGCESFDGAYVLWHAHTCSCATLFWCSPIQMRCTPTPRPLAGQTTQTVLQSVECTNCRQSPSLRSLHLPHSQHKRTHSANPYPLLTPVHHSPCSHPRAPHPTHHSFEKNGAKRPHCLENSPTASFATVYLSWYT